jgi:hypothetical protein
MKDSTKTLMNEIETQDHKNMGFLSCGGDEYDLQVGETWWSVDNSLVDMLLLIEKDNTVSSFYVVSGANEYDHVFTRCDNGWIIAVDYIESTGESLASHSYKTTQQIPMSVIIDTHPMDWAEKFDWALTT